MKNFLKKIVPSRWHFWLCLWRDRAQSCFLFFLKIIAAWLRPLKIQNSFFGPALGTIPSLKKWIARESSADWASESLSLKYHRVLPARKIVRTLPVNAPAPLPPRFHPHHTFPEAFVAEIPRGRIFGNGLILTEDKKIFEESAYGRDYVFNSYLYNALFLWPPKKYLMESFVSLLSYFGAGYYHWMFDLLPKIMLAEKVFPRARLNFLLPQEAQAGYISESLKLVGISVQQCVYIKPTENYLVGNLIYPSYLSLSGHPRREYCAWLRKKVFSRIPTAKPSLKIYISRKQSARGLTNEAEVRQFLAQKGFLILENENLSWLKQAEIFSQAQVVVAAHGAGLSNLVFAPEQARVIEILHPHYVNGCYFALCSELRQKYHCYFGEDAGFLRMSFSVKDLQAALTKI